MSSFVGQSANSPGSGQARGSGGYRARRFGRGGGSISGSGGSAGRMENNNSGSLGQGSSSLVHSTTTNPFALGGVTIRGNARGGQRGDGRRRRRRRRGGAQSGNVASSGPAGAPTGPRAMRSTESTPVAAPVSDYVVGETYKPIFGYNSVFDQNLQFARSFLSKEVTKLAQREKQMAREVFLWATEDEQMEEPRGKEPQVAPSTQPQAFAPWLVKHAQEKGFLSTPPAAQGLTVTDGGGTVSRNRVPSAPNPIPKTLDELPPWKDWVKPAPQEWRLAPVWSRGRKLGVTSLQLDLPARISDQKAQEPGTDPDGGLSRGEEHNGNDNDDDDSDDDREVRDH